MNKDNKNNITIELAISDDDIKGIYDLHIANLKDNLSIDEIQKEGFVTAVYDVSLLTLMKDTKPSIIAKDNVTNKVIGYALVYIKELRSHHRLIDDLFMTVDKLSYKGNSLSQCDYVVVGQLCVAKGYRGIGIVQDLYNYYKEVYSSSYQYLITDVARDNPRSLKAHIKSSFEVINTIVFDDNTFDVILWDWRSNK